MKGGAQSTPFAAFKCPAKGIKSLLGEQIFFKSMVSSNGRVIFNTAKAPLLMN